MNDLISRQAAIDALRTCYDTETISMDNGDEYINYGDAVGEIEHLPSAQPEIIRCKDCLWRIGRDCTRFTDLPVYMDDYCGRAKRRGEQDDESRSNSNAQTDTRARGMGATDKSSGI